MARASNGIAGVGRGTELETCSNLDNESEVADRDSDLNTCVMEPVKVNEIVGGSVENHFLCVVDRHLAIQLLVVYPGRMAAGFNAYRHGLRKVHRLLAFPYLAEIGLDTGAGARGSHRMLARPPDLTGPAWASVGKAKDQSSVCHS